MKKDLLKSFLFMSPWPILGAILALQFSQEASQMLFLFSGFSIVIVSLIFKGLITLEIGDLLFSALFSSLWVFVLIYPIIFKNQTKLTYIILSLFSFLQALFGVVMILGMNF